MSISFIKFSFNEVYFFIHLLYLFFPSGIYAHQAFKLLAAFPPFKYSTNLRRKLPQKV